MPSRATAILADLGIAAARFIGASMPRRLPQMRHVHPEAESIGASQRLTDPA